MSASARILRTARNLLPPLVVNGLIFLLPAWVTVADLLVLLSLAGVLVVWVALELKWSSYVLRLPVGRK